NIDAVNKFSFSEGKFQLISGLNYQKHNNNTISDFGNIDKSLANFNSIDPYATLVYVSDYGLNFNVGGRYNEHSKYGNHFVYDVNSSYSVLKNKAAKLKVLASYGTSFVAPSTYQLFSQYGNLDLNPETNTTIEAGFEFGYKKLVQFNAVYFNRKENDAIIFVSLPVAPWTSQYQNAINEIKVSGI
ncbi:MAG: TonB-dependent receptor domain-containing protein, partial [Polaribacter sp.]